MTAMDQFLLKDASEALHRIIIITVPTPTHRGFHSIILHQILVVVTTVLAATIKVVQQPLLRSSGGQCPQERLTDKIPTHPFSHGIAYNFPVNYKSNGTTCLFAAMNILEGKIIGSCYPRHRNIESLKFLRTIDREVPPILDIHTILDNYGTHGHPNVKL